MANHYEIPNWAGKAPTGHHLDVTKDDKLIQKLMIDEKKCYLFGRNKQMNDFCIDHASCSRVHAALVYHKHLNLSYLVDLGSSKCLSSIKLWKCTDELHWPFVFMLVFSFDMCSTWDIHWNAAIGAEQTNPTTNQFNVPFWRFNQVIKWHFSIVPIEPQEIL